MTWDAARKVKCVSWFQRSIHTHSFHKERKRSYCDDPVCCRSCAWSISVWDLISLMAGLHTHFVFFYHPMQDRNKHRVALFLSFNLVTEHENTGDQRQQKGQEMRHLHAWGSVAALFRTHTMKQLNLVGASSVETRSILDESWIWNPSTASNDSNFVIDELVCFPAQCGLWLTELILWEAFH